MSYGQIHEKFWNDSKVRQLEPLEAYLFIYLFSNPQRHFSGLYYLRPTIIAEETKFTPEQVEACLSRLEELGFIEYDRDTFTIWVRNMLHYCGNNRDISPQQFKGILKHLNALEYSKLFIRFLEKYREKFSATLDRLEEKDGDHARSTLETQLKNLCYPPMPKQDQNHNQNQKKKKKQKQKKDPIARGINTPMHTPIDTPMQELESTESNQCDSIPWKWENDPFPDDEGVWRDQAKIFRRAARPDCPYCQGLGHKRKREKGKAWYARCPCMEQPKKGAA